eukprot:TRINITY_DN75929_c0_g1_i1.p1 TRINITY_DN75929_c0_g1~~TRINITY_DN75929_c0_g1_i1.p1  ORF type:complete len:215 (+),score=32.90 TRINITY_DN75929_c0_g1_i1:112-756(+)
MADATQAEYYVFCAVCVPLGLMFTVFAIFNLIHNTGALGSFGHKFGYEMDVVMGGLLGIPHYSKVESVMLAFGAAGAAFAVTRTNELVAVLGLSSAAAYMYVCALYAYFAKLWKQEGSAFVVMGTLSAALVCWRWVRFMPASDADAAGKGVVFFIAFTVICGMIMKVRAPSREAMHDRFVMIFDYCEQNKDFVWSAGDDCPQGFTGAGASLLDR